ncbi:MAG: glucosaminidase domain-containing protein [Candidatus Pacebacteria bacterium]|nr:glucosaminidase domain-containing protein [Candidatus Paceibacterota bacterium]
MQNKKLIRFVESLVLLPFATMSVPLGGLTQAGYQVVSNSQIVLSAQQNIEADGLLATNAATDQELAARSAKAKAIDAYFEKYDMPLKGTGMKMVLEAEKNDLDWRLIAAIAVRESTGGKHECQKVANNPFGWGSCKIGFKSNDAAIETVARNLGGNNPKTAHHYDEKTTIQILRAYNPPSIVPRYAQQVMAIMNAMGAADIDAVTGLAVNS